MRSSVPAISVNIIYIHDIRGSKYGVGVLFSREGDTPGVQPGLSIPCIASCIPYMKSRFCATRPTKSKGTSHSTATTTVHNTYTPH